MQFFSDWIPILKLEIAKVGAPPFALSFVEMMQVLGSLGTSQVDDACRQFVSGQGWPPLSDAQRLEVCARLDCAIEWCEVCGEGLIEQHQNSKQSSLENILIDYWLEAGREKWLSWALFGERVYDEDESSPGDSLPPAG